MHTTRPPTRVKTPPPTGSGLGPVYTEGESFRARAEARQRVVRANDLAARWSGLGHFLDRRAVADGANFVTSAARDEAVARRDQGKGVATRTFANMLSSQAMCFNLFAPLRRDLALASRVLRRVIPDLAAVTHLEFEYTPPWSVFEDQHGFGGVDCDLLLEATVTGGRTALVTIETKFVEREFSICGFRKAGRAKRGEPVCPAGVCVGADRGGCLYRYLYWRRSDELGTLAPGAVPDSGCPFAGPTWQLWVNHTLAHDEARRRKLDGARFLVCAPRDNEALRRDGVLEGFRALLADPATFGELLVDDLLAAVDAEATTPELRAWSAGLARRYGAI